ncbi:lisH domain-containing protein ARMC9-like isoform X2 [Aphidius gifuensis]|uniref:lisH domain-containing protein ARMC9-like isoform X2 n=1 Tax=Aphidius gifuensis TaxID=684658 RepID=UPI001CDB9C4C|nr:lisH domain-containing protein ARMC9-like isoform X2 [Aphidius gifuensis]
MDKIKVDDISADESLINLCDLNGDSITMVIADSNVSKQSRKADNSSEKKSLQAQSFLLIENDRDIPDFLELEHRDEVDLCCCEGLTKNVTTRCTQTKISGVNESVNVMLTTDLNHPATILNKKKSPIPNQYSQDLMLARSQLGNVNRKYQKLKERFHKLHSDYHKLMGIAKEFTIVLGNAACGKSVDPQKTLATCMKIYPDLFDPNIRHEPPITPLESTLNIHNIDNEMKKFISSAVPLSPKHLDYKKIKIHLIHGNLRTKMLLLQALRWTITLSQPEDRDEVVHEYIRNDLLGLHGQIASDTGKLILPYLLMPLDVAVPHPIQQSAARLLNAFASLKCGRDYLAVGPTVLNVVIQCLDSTNAESIDAFTCDMIIAMLQKLSLRRQQRLYMIAAGLVEWLTHHLKSEYHSMGTYRLEYATALLMNLSLHKEAQMRAAEMSTMIISTLIVLLSTNHLPALQYVNGALNNFLTNKSINDEARHIGLGSILEHHRKQRTGELRAHLDDILMKHRRQQPEMIEEEINDVDDDREEYDVLEDELDEIDPVKVNAGDLFGETLLAICYCLTPSHLQVVQDTHNLTPRTFNLYDETSDLNNSMNHTLDDQSIVQTCQRITHYPRITPTYHKSKYKNPVKLESQNSYENNEKLFYATIKQSDSNKTIIDKSCLSLEIPSVSQASIRAIEQRYNSINIEDNFFQNNIIKNNYYNEQESISSNSRITNVFTENSWDKNQSLISKYLKISPNKISSFHDSRYCDNQFYVKHKSKESTTSTAESTHEEYLSIKKQQLSQIMIIMMTKKKKKKDLQQNQKFQELHYTVQN